MKWRIPIPSMKEFDFIGNQDVTYRDLDDRCVAINSRHLHIDPPRYLAFNPEHLPRLHIGYRANRHGVEKTTTNVFDFAPDVRLPIQRDVKEDVIWKIFNYAGPSELEARSCSQVESADVLVFLHRSLCAGRSHR